MVILQQRDPFKTIFKYFKYYGMWMDISVRRRSLSLIIFLLLNLSCCILVILSLFHSKNIEDFTRCTIYSSIYLISLSCAINFNVKRNEIQDLIDDINQVINEYPLVMNDFIEKDLRKCNQMFRVTFRVSCVIIGTGTIIEPFLFGKIETPIYFLTEPELFHIAWIVQGISSFYSIYLTILNAELSCNLLIIIHSYVKFFKYSLRNVNWKSKEDLIKCIEIHRNVQRLVRKLENIVQIPFGVFGFFGTSVLCTIAFRLSQENIINSTSLAIFIHHGGRAIVIMAQIFRACYFSHKIQSSSEECITDLFVSNWVSSYNKHNYGKLKLIFNENLKHPIKITVFKTFIVNLETFQTILNLVYSLYTLLKNIKS